MYIFRRILKRTDAKGIGGVRSTLTLECGHVLVRKGVGPNQRRANCRKCAAEHHKLLWGDHGKE
jgi:hypothetical protein